MDALNKERYDVMEEGDGMKAFSCLNLLCTAGEAENLRAFLFLNISVPVGNRLTAVSGC